MKSIILGHWFGVTFREDVPAVKQAIRELIDNGMYPEKLFDPELEMK